MAVKFPYRAVLFDFDLTLGDATGAIIECYHYGLSQMGYPVPDDDAIRRTIGMTVTDSYRVLSGCEDEDRLEEMYRLHRIKGDEIMIPGTEPMPYANELLDRLHAAGARIGIVSSKIARRLVGSMEKFGRLGLCDVIIGFDDVPTAKPSPEGLNLAMERLGVRKEDVLYVGDSFIDAQTGEAAGVDFAGVLTGATTREEMEQYRHVTVVDDLGGLIEYLKL